MAEAPNKFSAQVHFASLYIFFAVYKFLFMCEATSTDYFVRPKLLAEFPQLFVALVSVQSVSMTDFFLSSRVSISTSLNQSSSCHTCSLQNHINNPKNSLRLHLLFVRVSVLCEKSSAQPQSFLGRRSLVEIDAILHIAANNITKTKYFQEVEAIFALGDINDDGAIDLEEFIGVMYPSAATVANRLRSKGR